mgnify:CR=1 FL=1
MRGVLGQTIIGFPAPDYPTTADALAGTEKFLQRFKGDPLIVHNQGAQIRAWCYIDDIVDGGATQGDDPQFALAQAAIAQDVSPLPAPLQDVAALSMPKA